MRPVLAKIKPVSGFASFFHYGLLVALPLVVFLLIRLQFVQLAFIIIVLSKWRMFAVRPRFWLANIRANAVDLMVGLSIVLFMNHSASLGVQFLWAVAYGAWLIYLKPATGTFMISTQAGVAQLLALMALYASWANGPIYGLTLLTGLICFLAARHFFDSFDETYVKLVSYMWGYFGAALAWVLCHWLLFYGFLGQPTLLLSTIGYGLAVLYYFDHNDRLSNVLKRQFIFIMIAIILVVLTFSDWGDKVV